MSGPWNIEHDETAHRLGPLSCKLDGISSISTIDNYPLAHEVLIVPVSTFARTSSPKAKESRKL